MANSAWLAGDTQTRLRRNREWIIGRFQMPVYDVQQDGTVTVKPIVIDGDDIVTTETTHYTVPGTGVAFALVRPILVVNGASAARTAKVHLVENGGSRSNGNAIYDASMVAGQNDQLLFPFAMGPGASVRSIGSGMAADEVALRFEGLEFSSQPDGMTIAVATTNGSGIDGHELTNANATYYTAPSSKKSLAFVMVRLASSASAQGVYAYLIKSGGSAAGRKAIVSATFQPGQLICGGPYQMDPGDFIQARADNNSVASIRVTPLECD